MATIDDIIQSFENADITETLSEAIDATKETLIELQQIQLSSGKSALGDFIGIYKNPAYALKKYALNPLPGLGKVDLKLTGQWYRGIFVDVRDNFVVIDNIDNENNKTNRLYTLYGEQILGLNPEFAAQYSNEVLQPAFTVLFLKKL